MTVDATVTIRPADPPDVDALLALWEVMAVKASAPLDHDARTRLGAHLRASLRHPRVIVLCAVGGEHLVGFCTAHVDVHPTMDGALGVVDELFVHPVARRGGVGRVLLAEALGRLDAKGVRGVRMEVHPADDDAAAFAFTQGFTRGAHVWNRSAPGA